MHRESHHPRQRHHHVDVPAPEAFASGGPDGPGPGRGRGRRHGPGRGRTGPGFGPEGPGPRGRRRRPRGAVREAVLALLAEGPANGYSLMRQIAERTDGAWAPSPGSVYPTLSQLVDEGLIRAISADKGTDFDLTDSGRQFVADHVEALAQVWAEPMRGAPSHAALRDSVTALMGVTHQFRFATDEQRQQAARTLDETRRALHRILAE